MNEQELEERVLKLEEQIVLLANQHNNFTITICDLNFKIEKLEEQLGKVLELIGGIVDFLQRRGDEKANRKTTN